jgi:hypothetical protein
MTCAECSSSSFRLSRFRMKDVERLLLLQYPVRCRHCHRRAYAELPLAFVLLQADRVSHARREHEAARRRASYLADDGLSDRISAGILTSWTSSACDAFAVRISVSIWLDEEEEETVQGSRKSPDCRHQKGDGGAAIGEVSPRRSEIPNCAGRQRARSLTASEWSPRSQGLPGATDRKF